MTLYDVGGQYDFLAEADVIAVEGPQEEGGRSGEPTLIQITNKQTITGMDFLDSLMVDPSLNHRVKEQIGERDRPTASVGIQSDSRLGDSASPIAGRSAEKAAQTMMQALSALKRVDGARIEGCQWVLYRQKPRRRRLAPG
jgi:hypothetical protein